MIELLERELKTVLDCVRIDDLGLNELDFGILKERILSLSEKFFEKEEKRKITGWIPLED